MFVFSLLAPFVLPIINQVKTELNTGSSEIIQSSKDKQLVVWLDDNSTDPTHSMLSKDHFSNILNEPAGKVASQVLKWVVPQLIACWDDERIDANRTLTRIVNGVFHHPAQRDYGDDGAVDGRRLMFGVVQQWWGSKDEQERRILRDQLSREGVEQGRNHKEGVQDTGHGCCKPLGMPTVKTAQSSGAVGGLAGGLVGGLAGGAVLDEISSAFAGESKYDAGYTGGGGAAASSSGGMGKFIEEGVGGGALGGIVGGLAGGLGGDLLGGAFAEGSKKKTYQNQQYEADGSYTQSFTETGYNKPQQRSGQAEYSQTAFVEGGQRQQFQRYEQDDSYGRSGYGEQVIQESRPTYGGGYEQTTETRYERPGGNWESEVRVEGREKASGGYYEETNRFEGRGGYRDEQAVSHEAENDYGYQERERERERETAMEREREIEREREQAQNNTYENESRYEERPAYGAGGYGGREESVEERQGYGGGGAGFFGGGEERREEFDGGRGYEGGGNEYEQREEREEYREEGYGRDGGY